MAKGFENKIQVPFYPLTEEGLKDWYRKKYMTVTGYILGILKVIRPPGAVLSIPDVAKFCREWEISRSAFYKAISVLKANGDIEWEAIAGVKLRIPEKIISIERKSVSNRGHLSPIVDAESTIVDVESTIVDVESPIVDAESPIVDEKRPEPLSEGDSGTPQTIQTYQTFTNSLSNSERESFENFCKKEVAGFPRPIINLCDYLAADDGSGQPRYLEFWQRFGKTKTGAELRSQQAAAALTPELYDQWDKEFRAVGCDYIKFGEDTLPRTPERELKMKFFEEWDKRNLDVVPVLY